MQIYRNLTVVSKLLLMLAPPVFGVVLMSLVVTVERVVDFREMGRAERLAHLAAAVNEAVYALQAERSLSAARLVSNELRGDALEKARAESDAVLTKLRERSAEAELADISLSLANAAGAAFRELEQLDPLREAVSAERMDPDAALDGYSLLNGRLLELVADLPGYSDDANVARMLSAYTAALRAMEAAGAERATVAGALLEGRISEALKVRLAELTTAQQLYLKGFFETVPEGDRQRYRGMITGEYEDRLRRFRQALLEASPYGAAPVAAKEWLGASGERVDRLTYLVVANADQLQAEALRLRNAAGLELVIFSLMNVLGLALTVWLAWQVTRRISRHVTRLLGALGAFRSGDLKSRVDMVEQDELGSIAGAFNDMADGLEQSAERERARLEREKARSEVFHAKVERIGEALRVAAFGDLTQRVELEDDPDLGQIAYHVNMMVNGLRELTRGMVEATGEMATSVMALQESAQSQSAAAAEQASATNETVTTLQEIRTISTQSKQKAHELGRTADRAMAEGNDGRQQVERTMDAMGLIRSKVEAIGDSLGQLREQMTHIEAVNEAVASVAQQSKMLALNAAIEAAKAGKAGRGFGIVAAEVGGLADQSAGATVEVGRILRDIRKAMDSVVGAVEEGTWDIVQALGYVEQAGSTIARLSDVAQETATASKQIVAAVSQEAIGIDQLANAVEEINRATGQFAQTSRRLESAARDIRSISDRLQEQSEVYEV